MSDGPSIGDLIAALRQRWRLAAAIAASIALIVGVWALLQPRVYRASASLLFDAADPDPTATADKGTGGSALVATQADVLRSAAVARRAAHLLQLDRTPTGTIDPALGARASAALRPALTVTTAKGSNVLIVSADDRDPARAAAIANAFAQAYLRTVPDLRAAAARGYSAWLEERTSDVRARLEAAQRRLAAYERAHAMVGASRFDLDAEGMRTLNAELAQAEGATAEARSRAGSSAIPEVEASATVQQLRTSVATQAARVAELGRTLGPNHPDMQAAIAQLAALRAELATAVGTASRAMTASSAAALRREGEVRARLAARQRAMIAASTGQNELTVLQRDVDAAQQTYDQVRKALGEQFLRSQVAQTNASALDQASAPVFPVEPNVPLLVLLGCVFGVAVGITAVIGFELIEPRLRTEESIRRITGQRVLALS